MGKLRNEAVRIKEELVPVLKRSPQYTKLIVALLRDPSLSTYQKGILLSGLGYSVSPIDLVPGIIPVAGQLDDLVVILAALNKVLEANPKAAEKHLKNTGLSREVISGDLDTSKEILKRLGKIGFRTSKKAFSKILTVTREKIFEAYALISRAVSKKST